MALFGKSGVRKIGWKKARVGLLLGLIPGILGLALVHWPVTADLEKTRGLDFLFKLRGARPAVSDICVVAIDDASYIELGIDPFEAWPRALHADLIRVLKSEGASAVAFDVLFEGPREPVEGDIAFELALFDTGNVVLGATVERIDDPRFKQVRLIEPHPPFAETAAAVGEVELPPDNDGLIRETWLIPEDRPSLALAAYEVATGDMSFREESTTRVIDYYGGPRTISTVSLYQALDPGQYLPPDFFRDRIVFVGLSQVAAQSIAESKDSFPTPFSGGEVGYTFGVEIHATIAANLLEERRVDLLPPVIEGLALVGLALLASLLFIFLRPIVGLAVALPLMLLSWVVAYLAFTRTGTWIPVVIPSVVQLPAAYTVSLVWYYLTTVREREKIRRAFSFYLSPEMIQRISEDPDSLSLGGEEIVGTALFTDIAGFTSTAEGMTAPETASMLNDYFSDVTQTIFDTRGTLIKYIGDAVFAIYGAPLRMEDHATRACQAAVAMARMRETLGDRWAGKLPTRIGVHTGQMLVGNLGSAQRFDYTAIGDTINLAARLESLNKSTGTQALISGETLEQTDGNLIVRSLGRVRVVGRAEPVALYELLGPKGEPTRPDLETIRLFEQAIEDFAARRFPEATTKFQEVRDHLNGDGPSDLYLNTIAQLKAHPPDPTWDAIINFTKK